MTIEDYLRAFTGVRRGLDTIINSLSMPEGTLDNLVTEVLELENKIGRQLGEMLLMDMKVGDFKEEES